MATLEAPDHSLAEEKQQQGPPSPEDVTIHVHLFEPQLKAAGAVQFGKQLLKYLGSGDKAAAKEVTAQLDMARSTLTAALESTSMSEESVQGALQDYLAALLGLVEQSSPEVGTGLNADAPLRRSISFSWRDALVGSSAATAFPDAIFELASTLVAASVWCMRRAASLCRDSASGVAAGPSMQANKLLRQAAGMLEYVGSWVLPLLPAGVAEDCNPELVKGLSLLCLADCQMITVLRAIQKGNQPSLIASIAGDTAALLGSSLQAVLSSTVPAAAGSKLAHYLRYKQAALQAYTQCFSGIAQWKAGQAGAGLRCLQEAQTIADAAKKISLDYDKAGPATLNSAHRRCDEILQAVITDSKLRVEKENAVVFLQKVPLALPEAPTPKRLVAAMQYALPQLSPAVQEGLRSFKAAPAASAGGAAAGVATSPSEGPVPSAAGPPAAGAGPAAPAGDAAAAAPPGGRPSKEEEEGQGCCCSCLRWAVFLIAFPLMLLISAVGIVIWIVLLPVKIICCPCGCLIQMLANVVEYMIKAPLRLMLWAVGKPWESGKAEEGEKKGSRDPPV